MTPVKHGMILVCLCFLVAAVVLAADSSSTLTKEEFVQKFKSINSSTTATFLINSVDHKLEKSLHTTLNGGRSLHLYSTKEGRKGPSKMVVKHVKKVDEKDQGWLGRVMQEVYLLKAIDHPNVMRLYSGYVKYGVVYMVTEYFERGTLDRYQIGGDGFGKLEIGHLKSIIKNVLKALTYLHSYGIIHRDIKPANIALHGEGAKLIDLGMCTPPTTEPTEYNKRMGSEYFVAPEMMQKRSYNALVDIWALGISIWVLFADPYRQETKFTDHDELWKKIVEAGKPWNGRECIPSDLADFIDHAVVFDPENRAHAETLLSMPNFQ